jgi:hypothetical protein
MEERERSGYRDDQEERRHHYVAKSVNTMYPYLVRYINFLDGERPTIVNFGHWRERLIATRTLGNLVEDSGGNRWRPADYVRYATELLQRDQIRRVPNNATGLFRKKKRTIRTKRKIRTRRRSFI